MLSKTRSSVSARFRLLGAPALALSMSPAPAQARDWPETAGWTIVEGDTYCGMSLEYEGKGETKLLVAHDLDGSVMLIVANYGWSAKKDADYALDFYLGGKAYGGGKSRGTEVGIRKGFVTGFGPEFWPDFKAAASLRIAIGDTLVDHLRLSGTAAAGVVVDRCLAHVRALRDAEEREHKRFAHIPDDPFAAAKSEPTPPRFSTSAGSWVTNDDYPAAALRAGEQGTVKVRLDVTAQGRVEKCTVIGSSGSALLDAATCTLLQRRARLSPATDGSGNMVAGSLEHQVHWSLPS